MVPMKVLLGILGGSLLRIVAARRGPFFNQIDNSTWVFGNDYWNVTQNAVYATPAYYLGTEIVGTAVGHYIGYDGENDFTFTAASITSQGDNYIDIAFSASEGDLHWVVFDDLHGAYQYFVNVALPDLEILRTLWRLDPKLFLNGRTYLRDEPLPDFSLYANATKIEDETWQLANGTYITKYSWSDEVRERDFYGIYGPGRIGSWWIHAGQDYYNSNQLSQTLTVHRESSTGDSVQLNVVQDTSHFRVGADSMQFVGKIWGPWLWYLNNGSLDDVQRQRTEELQKYPYSWLKDTAYQSRGSVSGTIRLSDGRVAAGASVYLGDNDTSIRPLVQGSNYYYTTTADSEGHFYFSNVRTGTYGLYAWSNGGSLADVYSNITRSSVIVTKGKTTTLSNLVWQIPKTNGRIFQLGAFDKKSLGFKNGGPPYEFAVAEKSPANLTYTIGTSNTSDWYYAQSQLGTWTIEFELTAAQLAQHKNGTALLSVSLASYSQSTALDISVNDQLLASLDKTVLASDPALYRAGNTNGEWRFEQYDLESGVLKEGWNTVGFTVTRYTQFRGFMYDTIILEWK